MSDHHRSLDRAIAKLNEPPELPEPEEILECARCGVPGAWRNGELVNPGPAEVPPFCRDANGRPRSHGPFVPRAQP